MNIANIKIGNLVYYFFNPKNTLIIVEGLNWGKHGQFVKVYNPELQTVTSSYIENLDIFA